MKTYQFLLTSAQQNEYVYQREMLMSPSLNATEVDSYLRSFFKATQHILNSMYMPNVKFSIQGAITSVSGRS